MDSMRSDEFITARQHIKLSPGEAVRMLRGLKGWTRTELARRSGISAADLYLLEYDKIETGKRKVQALASAFGVHPAAIKCH